MNFITVDPNLMRHPKTIALATELQIRAREAASIVVAMWSYAFQSAPGGDLTDLRARPKLALAALDMPDAESTARAFDAMQEVGFLDVADGRTLIHDWSDGAGRLEAKRARDAERQRSHRVTRSSQPVTVTSRYVTACHTLEEKREEKNRRELGANAPLSADADAQTSTRTPYDDFFAAYGELSPPFLPFPKKGHTDETLKTSVRAAWKKHPDLDWWKLYFRDAAKSDFLTGKATQFVASLPWLIGPKNMAKVLGGAYTNGGKSQTRIQMEPGEAFGG